MNIGSLKGSPIANQVTATNQNPKRTPSSIPPAPNAAAASTQISGPGQLFSRLQQLAETDPAKFKEVAQNIADQMHQAASGSDQRAKFENQLADKFAQAAQTGDLSPFQSQAGGESGHAQGHHHHHHHSGGHDGSNSIASILSNALDQVNQALATSTTPASASSSADTTSASADGASADSTTVATPE
jgi:hypothetical protein